MQTMRQDVQDIKLILFCLLAAVGLDICMRMDMSLLWELI